MPSRAVCLPLLALACLTVSGAAAEPPTASADYLAATRFVPAADGALVVAIVPGGAAEGAGIQPGDVVVAYGGEAVTDQRTAVAVIGARRDSDAPQPVVWMRAVAEGGAVQVQRHEAVVKAGTLGVHLRDAVGGTAIQMLPDATATWAQLDWRAALPEGRPRIAWHRFLIGGAHVGYEVVGLWREGDRIHQLAEVAFDSGGERWGQQHFAVENVLRLAADGRLVPERMRFEGPLWKQRIGAEITIEPDGRQRWTITERVDDQETRREEVWPADSLPDFLPGAVLALLPQREDLCLHFTLIPNMNPRREALTALVWRRESEPLPVALPTTGPLWRCGLHSQGSEGVVHWHDAGAGVTVLHRYGPDTFAVRATEAEALAGVGEAIQPLWRARWTELAAAAGQAGR